MILTHTWEMRLKIYYRSKNNKTDGVTTRK